MKPDFNKMALIPAIIQDEQTNEVLMLAYVNEEAYEKMIETKQTYFYSRSRNELWHKGETSGHFQHISQIVLDCDQDTLLIKVKQEGVACHTGAYSCFFNEVYGEVSSATIFNELYAMIQDRKTHPIEKSYTNYLFNEGIDKICKKIGEEASETIIAAKNEDKEELIGEIDDLIYHLFVLMASKDISLKEIQDKLKKRHQITGNKKEFHTKGDY